MRRDLENEDNGRIATILSRDYGLASTHRFAKGKCEVGMGVSGTQVGENAVRDDLDNEDNGRITILAHDEGVLAGRQFNEVEMGKVELKWVRMICVEILKTKTMDV